MAVKKSMLSVDGNTAAAIESYNFIEIAGIFPITPSSPMAEQIDVDASKGKLNYFGEVVKVSEMQSEAGASGAVHGAIQGGALAATYTASQGLLLMIPNIYKWVGELLPVVLHVSARSLATRSLSIFGDHQDIYAIRQTGIAMICSHSVQEIADLTPVAHLVALDAEFPVCHFFDGFRTSHEVQNVEFVDDEEWKKLVPFDKVEKFRSRALNPHTHSVTRGGAENDDVYFQGREAQNKNVENVIAVAEKYFKKASELTGRNYAPFTYYGDPNAERVIVAMGSVTETATEVIDELNGEKIGLVKVHLYRPFSAKHFLSVLPKSVKKIAVLDRTKEPGAAGEPLYLDVAAVIKDAGLDVEVIGGRYGLSSKDTQPKHVKAVFDFLKGKTWNGFTVSIDDDVTHLSIPVDNDFHVHSDYTSCLFYGLGSDGTVSANKSSIKIIGDATGQYAQAYFAYDSRKAGGVTRSHLRFGKNPIHSTYYVENADFISCSLDSYVFKFDMIKNLKVGGTFLLNTDMSDEDLEKNLPNRVKYQLATKKAKFFVIDANKLAMSLGMGRHTNTTLQASFFYLNQQIMPYDEAQKWMKKFAEKSYAKKGQEVVEMNWKAIDAGAEGLREVKVNPEWVKLSPKVERKLSGDDYFDNYVSVVGNLDGYDLPVSKFQEYELLDGTMKNDITFKEKRNIADRVPLWHKEDCIQCNQCAFVCPHATIRPFLIDEKELGGAPEVVKGDVKDAMGPGLAGLKFRIQVSPENCVGCGLCVSECLANKTGKKALEMVEAKTQAGQEAGADYLFKNVTYKADKLPEAMRDTVKGVGFLMPYMEVSGACAGCGETPYYRLVSQLFGKDMLVANATGCSSIYSGSTPLTPFCTDKNGEGVAWANSLFEDNAEFGYGMRLATNVKLAEIVRILSEAKARGVEDELSNCIDEYFANIENIHPEYIRPFMIDYYFNWEAVNSNANYTVDSTKYSEKMHTLTVKNGNGAVVLQNNFLIDNTAPSISANINDEDYVSSGAIFKYSASDDGSGIKTTSVKLDGVVTTATKGIPLDGLNIGAHSVSVTATDKAGNVASRSFNFNIVDKYASIKLNEKDGVITAKTGYDTTYNFVEYEHDELTMTNTHEFGKFTTSNKEMVYDEFEVTVKELNKDLYVSYDGETSENERILFEAYNPTKEVWEKVSVGHNGQTNFTFKPTSYLNNGKVQLRASPYKLDEGIDRAFWISDFQYLAKVDTKFADLKECYSQATKYMADEYKEGKVSYIINTGDIVDNPPEYTTQADAEWKHASQAWEAIDEAGLPYGTGAGNHDVGSSAEKAEYKYYSKYFGTKRNSTETYYGGSLNNNESHYDLITIGDYDFVIVYLGYAKEGNEEAISFANKVLKHYSHRNAIVATHAYLNNGGKWDTQTRADIIYEQIVKPNPNVKMVMCGHTDGSEVIKRQEGDRDIYELLSCYQFVETTTDHLPISETKHVTNGYKCNGEGWMKEMTFEDDTLKVHTFSPVLKKDKFSTDNGINYRISDYEIDIDLVKKEHSIITKGIRAVQLVAKYGSSVENNTGSYTIRNENCVLFISEKESSGKVYNFVIQ